MTGASHTSCPAGRSPPALIVKSSATPSRANVARETAYTTTARIGKVAVGRKLSSRPPAMTAAPAAGPGQAPQVAGARTVARKAAKNAWYATVVIENQRRAGPWPAISASLRAPEVSTYPKAVAPRTLGMAKARNPGQPRSRSRITGRYMPMHQVQLHAQ